jgi:hypothetical protein
MVETMLEADTSAAAVGGHREPVKAEVAIGVVGGHRREAVEAAIGGAVTAAVRHRFASAVVLIGTTDESASGLPSELEGIERPDWLSVVVADPTVSPPTGDSGPGAAIRRLLETARNLDVKALAVIDGGAPAVDVGLLLHALLGREIDFAAPFYRRQRFGGAVTRGILYPLTRSLYGKRVRYPIGTEFGCSARMVARLLTRPGWSEEATRTAAELSLFVEAVVSGLKLGQVVTGTKALVGVDLGDDLTQVLHGVLSPVFTEVERRVPVWQKIRGSEPVELVGTPTPIETVAEPFAPEAMLDAFRLGQQSLAEVWGLVLPPSALLELKRLAQASAPTQIADQLWARIVYDFALAYHTRVMSRDHLLAAFRPLYLGWFGSFIREMAAADSMALEQRGEKLCLAYEAEKPYFISRWRWPDRFSP